MANAGSDVDDESWEEASDIFEVRSEAGEMDPEEPEVSASDEEESTVIESTAGVRNKQSSKSLSHPAWCRIDAGFLPEDEV